MASRSLGTLTLDLIAKIAGFQQGMDKAARIADDRSRRISKAVHGMGKAVAGIFAGLSAGYLVRAIVHATDEQEKALALLQASIESTGGSVGYTAEQLKIFAEELQGTTRFSDEAIQTLEARLLAFTNVTGPEFKRLTELTLDFATAYGKDAAEAAKAFGVAVNSPLIGMKRLVRQGIVLDESTKSLVKSLINVGRTADAQNVLMDALAERFGGKAAKAADTFGGSLEQLKNALNDLLEGKTGLTGAKESIQELVEKLRSPEAQKAADTFVSGIILALGLLGKAFAALLQDATDLGNFIVRVHFGADAEDIEGVKADLAKLDEIRHPFRIDAGKPFDPADLFKGLDRIAFFGKQGGLVQWWSDTELDHEIARLKKILEANQPFIEPIIPAAGFEPPPSVKFLDLQDAQEKRIALFGKEGEAAELAYDLENSLAGEVTEKEGELLLVGARRIDSLTAQAEAVKALEAEEKKLQSTYDSKLKSLQEQANTTKLLTEADKLRFEFLEGELKKLPADKQQVLLEVAVRVDKEQAAEDLEDINLQIMELRGETVEPITIRFDEEHAATRARFEQTGDTAGTAALEDLRNKIIQQAEFNVLQEEAAKINDDLAAQEERIRNSQEVGATTEIDALRALDEERSRAAAQLEEIRVKMDAIATASGNPELVENAKRFGEELEKLKLQTHLLAQKIEGELKESMSSALGDFVKGTKSLGDAFGDMIKDIQNKLLDLISQQLIEKLFKTLGAGAGGGFENILGAFLGGAEEGGFIPPNKTKLTGEAGFELAYAGTGRTPLQKQKLSVVGKYGPELISGGLMGMTIINHEESVALMDAIKNPVEHIRSQGVDSEADAEGFVGLIRRSVQPLLGGRGMVLNTREPIALSKVFGSSKSVESFDLRKLLLFSKIPGFAEGGYLPPGQFGIAGEKQPELIYGGSTGLTIINNKESVEILRLKESIETLRLLAQPFKPLLHDDRAFKKVPGFEKGGYLPPGQFGIAGEKQPELIYGGSTGLTIINNKESVEILKLLEHPFMFPSRDTGGRGFPGQPVMIGSGAQPEMFIPDAPGTFVPKDGLGGMTENNFNFMIAAPEGKVSQATQQQIAAAALRGLASANRRNN